VRRATSLPTMEPAGATAANSRISAGKISTSNTGKQQLSISQTSPAATTAASSKTTPMLRSIVLKKMKRKSHTKSRRGCHSCKARKIKCGEEFPTCSHCLHRGATCSYPQDAQFAVAPSRSGARDVFIPFVPTPGVPQPPSSTPSFTLQEIGFFHHFLTSMEHPLPLGNSSVWLREIPQMAHEHPFLLHAILALGASDMDRSNPPEPLYHAVLKHRGRAIAGLNKALDDLQAWSLYGYSDAVLATCYALIYQTSRIKDGLEDMKVLVQGCALITSRIQEHKLKTALIVSPERPRPRVEHGLAHIQASIPVNYVSLIRAGAESLSSIEQATILSADRPFWKALTMTLIQFSSTPVEGYVHSIQRYGAWYDLARGLLTTLQQRDNWTALVLVASYLANAILLKVLIPLHIWPESNHRFPVLTLRYMTHWIEAIYEHVNEPHRRHVAWAKHVVQRIPELPTETRSKAKPMSKSSKGVILDHLQTRSVTLQDVSTSETPDADHCSEHTCSLATSFDSGPM
jgi:hypothetical protein